MISPKTLITQMTEFYSTAISIFPSTTLTGHDGVPNPPVVTCPVVTSYLKPCARQVTILPLNLPDPSDAPACGHESPMAYTSPSTLKIATSLPATVTIVPVPGGIW